MSYARKSSTLPVLFDKMLDLNFFSQSIVYDCVTLKFIVLLNELFMVRFILFNLHIHFQIHTFSCPLYIDKLNIFYYKLHSFQFLQYMNLEGKVISPDNIEG